MVVSLAPSPSGAGYVDLSPSFPTWLVAGLSLFNVSSTIEMISIAAVFVYFVESSLPTF